MVRSALLLLLLLFVGLPGSLQLVRYHPPRLMPPASRVVLGPGDTLRVRCEGRHPVTWNYTSLATPPVPGRDIPGLGPRAEGVDIAERVTVSDGDRQDNTEYPFVSHIEIRDVTFLDVGYQSCSFVGTEDLDVVQNVTRVYLFVDDPKHLLVKTSNLQFLTVTQNMESVLPCRPSHPDVKVILFKDGKKIQDLASRSMIYRNTEGFVIYSPVLTYHNGDFLCQAERAGARDELRIFTRFNPSTDTVQQPWINSEGAENAVLGGNFSLECRVHHQAGMFHTLSWSVPDASTGIKTGRIVQLAQKVDKPGDRIPGARDPSLSAQDVRRLVVTDTRVEDEGYYTCHVQDQNGHKNLREEFVAIHDNAVATVELRTDTTKFVTQVGESVKIVVIINAHPAPEVMWYGPDKQEIVNMPFKSTVSVFPDHTILQMLELGLEDTGEYRVVASSADGNATDSLTFDVAVQDVPRVDVRSPQTYFLAGARAELACEVTGWPTPVVSWSFAPCDTPAACDAAEYQAVEKSQMNAEEETRISQTKWRVQSALKVIAIKAGYYQCSASNKFPVPAIASTPFFVSDVAGGFGVLPTPALVVVGDRLNLTCAGSKLAFDSVQRFRWLKAGSGPNPPDPVMEGDGLRLASRETAFSYQSVLVLTDVGPQHAGRYLCQATDLLGRTNTSDRLVQVQGTASPQFMLDANMDKSATITLEEGTRGELNCTVSGLPPPEVTWTKDGAPLALDENGRVRLSEDGQRLLISAAISDDAGNYECRAANRVGVLQGSAAVLVPGSAANLLVIIIVTVVMVLILIALATCLVWKIRQQKNLQRRLTKTELEAFANGRMTQFNPNMPIDEQAELLPYDDEWEFPKDKLILGRQIGSGAFGRVVKAEAVGLLPHEPRTVVAVKMPKSGSDPNQIRSMMAELKIMIQLGKHLNVVNLLGAVTKHAEEGEFMVLVEYCRHGNLHQYLHRHKNCYINQVDAISGEYDASLGEEEYEAALLSGAVNERTPLNYVAGGGGLDRVGSHLTWTSHDSHYKSPRRNSTTSSLDSSGFNTDMTGATVCHSPAVTGYEDSQGVPRSNTGVSVRQRRTPLTTRDLLRWSYQVARGMEYLASRKLLHGDLAARNILLAENNIVKISDFGLSRDIYKTRDYKKKGKGLLPVKWMAIESIQDSVFSTQSDVWAFGVVMWEFFSLGSSPYPGMEYDINFVRRLRDGYRMEMPKFSPLSAYNLMLECWAASPGDRPNFTEISVKLGHFLEERVREEYMQLNEPYRNLTRSTSRVAPTT
ncbi:vascular endothelial growth factor receptor 1-like isoform X2 [Pollicipes pollicipes]|uniref:vascular endothelial growth factor receptor 1-like isoform X2 n=1 Tax=Pollicipes pollicipes TaxID=41117 RepID=UPI001884EAED|nr:vascular endothelial growth factor receptor 1-like isoform X2 [Pollicipes pollicipes]